jgi:hypothetical protein
MKLLKNLEHGASRTKKVRNDLYWRFFSRSFKTFLFHKIETLSIKRTRKKEMIPFGKYKNQSIDVILQDDSYCNWLLDQAHFFASKPEFKWVLDVVESYKSKGGQSHSQISELKKQNSTIDKSVLRVQSTKEHNKIQLFFLNEAFRKQFIHHVMIQV